MQQTPAELDYERMIEDLHQTRRQLIGRYCLETDDDRATAKARIAIGGQFLHQAMVVLASAYGGDQTKALTHARMLLAVAYKS